jgi:hypothetical protein
VNPQVRTPELFRYLSAPVITRRAGRRDPPALRRCQRQLDYAGAHRLLGVVRAAGQHVEPLRAPYRRGALPGAGRQDLAGPGRVRREPDLAQRPAAAGRERQRRLPARAGLGRRPADDRPLRLDLVWVHHRRPARNSAANAWSRNDRGKIVPR